MEVGRETEKASAFGRTMCAAFIPGTPYRVVGIARSRPSEKSISFRILPFSLPFCLWFLPFSSMCHNH